MAALPELLLGIDAGTSACKAAALTLGGDEVALSRVPLPWRQVAGGAEMDPELLVGAALSAAADVTARAGACRVIGVGVTSMAETGVLLDRSGTPVAPAIAWHDERGEAEAAALAAAVGEDRFTARTGLALLPLCTAVKLRWLRDHLPSAEAGVRWLSVAEWIVHRLGGDQAAELSLAARTGFLDVAAAAWWEETAIWAGAGGTMLPELRPAGASWGAATVEAAGRTLAGAALTVAGHDHLCGAVGAGVTDPADVFDSCGTAEAFIRAVGGPPLSARTVAGCVAGGVNVGWHVVPGRQALLGAQRAGLALQRFRDLLGRPGADPQLEADAAALEPGAGGLRVVDPTAERAALAGIPREPSPAMVWRAAVEAVVDGGCRLLDVIAATGPVERVVMGGGWAQSAALRAVKRSRLGDRLELAGAVEACARGAAVLGGCCAGVYPDVLSAPRPPTTPMTTEAPGRTAHA